MASHITPDLQRMAYDQIVNLITSGELKPAEAISQRSLAKRLSISKQPVSMALQRLEYEGVVESAPRIGTRVKQIQADDVWGMLQWRIAVESRTAALAATWGNEEQKRAILDYACELDAERECTGMDEDRRGIWEREVWFHLLIAEASDCPRLKKELERLNIFGLKTALCEVVSATRNHGPAEPPTHIELAEIIVSGDSEKASRTMCRHLEESHLLHGFVTWYRKEKVRRRGR